LIIVGEGKDDIDEIVTIRDDLVKRVEEYIAQRPDMPLPKINILTESELTA
jgi:hypothetical protein